MNKGEGWEPESHRSARQVVNEQLADCQAETERMLAEELDVHQQKILLRRLVRDNPIRAYSLALEVLAGE